MQKSYYKMDDTNICWVFYMIGDFDVAIKEGFEANDWSKLKPKYRDSLESYLIRSTVLANPNLNQSLIFMLNKMSISDSSQAEKTESAVLHFPRI